MGFEQVAPWLEVTFGIAPDLQVVAVFFASAPARFVTRADLLTAVSGAQPKGDYGGAQHQLLPGRSPLAALTFECPLDHERFTVYHLDPVGPNCPHHPGTALVSVS